MAYSCDMVPLERFLVSPHGWDSYGRGVGTGKGETDTFRARVRQMVRWPGADRYMGKLQAPLQSSRKSNKNKLYLVKRNEQNGLKHLYHLS